jgi:hypothetical protein
MVFLLNMGVPMIMPTMFFMVVALIPIIAMETLYITRRLGIPLRGAVFPVLYANIASTFVGIPLTWGLLFVIQMIMGGTLASGGNGWTGKILEVTLQAPWLMPFPPEHFWVFHSAALFLLIPFFFATWLIEHLVARGTLAAAVCEAQMVDWAAAEKKIAPAVRNANLLSYGFIALLLIVSLVVTTISMR